MITQIVLLCICGIVYGQSDYEKCENFLNQYMPPRDVGNNPSFPDIMNETITYALLSRNTYDYTKSIPWEIFENYVLPYSTLSEPRDSWRKYLYNYLNPYAINMQQNTTSQITMWLINNYYNMFGLEFRDNTNDLSYSPFEVIVQGYASCSGMSVLAVDCLRAMGVPARIAGVPKWNTTCTNLTGNHNWIETYDPDTGYWSFTDASNWGNQPVMNKTWFYPKYTSCANPLEYNYSIWATSYAPTPNGYWFPMVWDWNARYVYAYNVTMGYLNS